MTRFAVAGGLMAVVFAGVVLADEKDLKQLEGNYKVLSLEKGGKPAPKEVMEGLTIAIKGDTFTITVRGEEKKAKIKADASKTPHTIDITPTDGIEKDRSFPGIYKIEKDEVTIAFSEKGDRPKDFKSEGETLLLTMKRETTKKESR